MVDALLATEDRNFYQHDGVSPLAIARAMVVNVKAGRTVLGVAVIDHHQPKTSSYPVNGTLWRKVREAYIALILDHRYSKDRILEAYLNEVYLGQMVVKRTNLVSFYVPVCILGNRFKNLELTKNTGGYG